MSEYISVAGSKHCNTLQSQHLKRVKNDNGNIKETHFLFMPTHWKQTLFMLDSPVSVHAGDSITGTIVLRRNPIWRRHMTITLHWNIDSSTEDTLTARQASLHIPFIIKESKRCYTVLSSFLALGLGLWLSCNVTYISLQRALYQMVSFHLCPQVGTKTFPMWRWHFLSAEGSRRRTDECFFCLGLLTLNVTKVNGMVEGGSSGRTTVFGLMTAGAR